MARVAQCSYNACKARGWWHLWGSNWKHGDALLFILSSAQIMYAYVMRPETLPPSYHRFIVKSGPIPDVALQATMLQNRGAALDVPRIISYVKGAAGAHAASLVSVEGLSHLIPCSVLHPTTPRCPSAVYAAFSGVCVDVCVCVCGCCGWVCSCATVLSVALSV
jgi:hypothetical protein